MPKKTFHFEENELREMYIEKNMRRIDIAEHYGCSDVLIKQQLKKFGIKKEKNLENENKYNDFNHRHIPVLTRMPHNHTQSQLPTFLSLNIH